MNGHWETLTHSTQSKKKRQKLNKQNIKDEKFKKKKKSACTRNFKCAIWLQLK